MGRSSYKRDIPIMKSVRFKILHVVTTIERGGAENQLLILVREQVAAGHEVTVLGLKGRTELRNEFLSLGIHLDTTLLNRSFIRQVFLLKTLLRKKWHIVHSHLPRAEVLVFMARPKIPWVTTRHNAEPFLPRNPLGISYLLSRLVLIRCKKVIAISMAVNSFLLRSREVKSKGEIVVIRYGIRRTRHKSLNLCQTAVPQSTLDLVTISRLSPQKDLPTLIRAFKVVEAQIPDSRLRIAGEGPLRTSLMSLVSQLGLSRKVKFLGKVSDTEQLLSQSDVFILTSLYEGFGLVLLEAMNCNLPIVACRNEAVLEVLGSDYVGLAATSSPEDVARLTLEMRDPIFRNNAISQISKRIVLFDSQEMSQHIEAVYRDISVV